MTTPRHFFEVKVYREGKGRGTLSAYPRPDVPGSPPPEFGGPDDRWSPEHLLAGAAALCFMTTLEAVARKARVELTSFQCTGEGRVALGPDGPGIEGLTLRAVLGVRGEAEQGRRLAELAARRCMIAQALKTPVEVLVSINGEPFVPAAALQATAA